MQTRTPIFVRCANCGQVYTISRAVEDRRAKCRPCGHEFVIPATTGHGPGTPLPPPTGQAVSDRLTAARMATITLRPRTFTYWNKRWTLPMAGGLFAAGLVALIVYGLDRNTKNLASQTLHRGRVAKLSAPRGDQEYTSVAELIEAVEPSIVKVEANGGIGSGFVLDKSGLVVTCHHCLENASAADVVFANGRRLKVLGTAIVAPGCDVDIIAVEPADFLVPLPLARMLPKKGEPIVAFGAPAGLLFTSCEGSVSGLRTAKELASLPGNFRMTSFSISPQTTLVQIAATTMPGNSGGPIVDFSGNVLGITSFTLDWHGRSYEFCISASEIRTLVDKLDGKMLPLWKADDGAQDQPPAIDR